MPTSRIHFRVNVDENSTGRWNADVFRLYANGYRLCKGIANCDTHDEAHAWAVSFMETYNPPGSLVYTGREV